MEHSHIYADGAYRQGTAAWALFCALVRLVDKSYVLAEMMADHVTIDTNDHEFIGAETITKYSAELPAITWALAWLAQLGTCALATIHAGNIAAVAVIMGEMAGSSQYRLPNLGRMSLPGY